MWTIWGRDLGILLSEQGLLSLGGRAEGHKCSPLTDEFNDRGEADEAERVSALPLSWTAVSETNPHLKTYLRTSGLVSGRYALPKQIGSILTVHPSMISVLVVLSEVGFANAMRVVDNYVAAPSPRSYRMILDFVGTRVEASTAPVPTLMEFYNQRIPYVIEERPSLSFRFGEPIGDP